MMTPSVLIIGTILNTTRFLSYLAWWLSPSRYFMKPCIMYELFDSPGCTLALIIAYFFFLYMGKESLESSSSNSDSFI